MLRGVVCGVAWRVVWPAVCRGAACGVACLGEVVLRRAGERCGAASFAPWPGAACLCEQAALRAAARIAAWFVPRCGVDGRALRGAM